MRNASTWWIIALIMLLLDLYVYQALRTVTNHSNEKLRMTVQVTYWVISGLTLVALLSFPYIQALQTSKLFRNYVFAILVGLFFAKILGSVFFLVDDLRRSGLWLLSRILPDTGARFMGEGNFFAGKVILHSLAFWGAFEGES